MRDDADRKLDILFAAARCVRPDSSGTEDFFETRIMTRIKERRERGENWLIWAWRLIPALAMIVVILGVLSVFSEGNLSSDLFASLGNEQAEYQVATYLGGE